MQFSILLAFIAGAIFGFTAVLFGVFKNVDALLGVDSSDPEKDRYNLVILCPLENLHKKKYLFVEVKHNKVPDSRNSQSV